MKGMFMCIMPIANIMDQPLVKLNGIDEGVSIKIITRLEGADDPNKVADAMQALFPEFPLPTEVVQPQFGSATGQHWAAENIPIGKFLILLHTQRILDTALDAMGRNMNENTTQFSLTRQAAIVGKVAFPLPDETPLGGTIDVHLTAPNLLDWLHAATWHKGRDHVPRTLNDERSMARDGEASTWT